MDLKDKLTQQEKEELFQQYQNFMSAFCDKCGKPYRKKDINVLQKQENTVVFHLACSYCFTNNFFYIVKPLGISNRMEIRTDLDADEIRVFTSYNAVSTNDIIDVHQQMEEIQDAASFIELIQ